MATPDLDTEAGASVYSPWVLRLYDGWVLGVSNRWAWRCPTEEVLLPFYRSHLGQRHLDVGVGTGWYLEHARLRGGQQVALLDLNPNSLRAAAARLDRRPAGLYAQDVMRPLDALAGQRFDSISLFYLLHCLPGGMAAKSAAIGHLAPLLAPAGTLYGATILGDGAGHNAFGRWLMALYNRRGIFGNRGDTVAGLRAMLEQHFAAVDVRRHGTVALFTARGPLAG
jgi:SAM-dependent methyltransferase